MCLSAFDGAIARSFDLGVEAPHRAETFKAGSLEDLNFRAFYTLSKEQPNLDTDTLWAAAEAALMPFTNQFDFGERVATSAQRSRLADFYAEYLQ